MIIKYGQPRSQWGHGCGCTVYGGRHSGRSPKWQRNYSGPVLVTKVLGLLNVVVQRTARTKPQVVNIDKLKPFLGEAPKS